MLTDSAVAAGALSTFRAETAAEIVEDLDVGRYYERLVKAGRKKQGASGPSRKQAIQPRAARTREPLIAIPAGRRSPTRASACNVKKTNPPPFCSVEGDDGMWCRLGKNLAALAREEFRRFGRKTHIVVLAGSED